MRVHEAQGGALQPEEPEGSALFVGRQQLQAQCLKMFESTEGLFINIFKKKCN